MKNKKYSLQAVINNNMAIRISSKEENEAMRSFLLTTDYFYDSDRLEHPDYNHVEIFVSFKNKEVRIDRCRITGESSQECHIFNFNEIDFDNPEDNTDFKLKLRRFEKIYDYVENTDKMIQRFFTQNDETQIILLGKLAPQNLNKFLRSMENMNLTSKIIILPNITQGYDILKLPENKKVIDITLG